MADYEVNEAAVAHVRDLIDKHQYVLESTWGDAQPDATAENAYLERHSWDEYAAWHLADSKTSSILGNGLRSNGAGTTCQ